MRAILHWPRPDLIIQALHRLHCRSASASYEVLYVIRRGRHGRGSIARDTKLNREVAIKAFRRNLRSMPTAWRGSA
jgi:hypothetical protein